MGEGRKIHGGPDAWGRGREKCPGTEGKLDSQDGYHHWTAITCVQSVEHFVCDHCDDEWWD
jgi:hypothetical protein